jgi:hypothetical protein
MNITAIIGETGLDELGFLSRAYFVAQYLDSPILVGALSRFDLGRAYLETHDVPLVGIIPKRAWALLPDEAKSVRGLKYFERDLSSFRRLEPSEYPEFWSQNLYPTSGHILRQSAEISHSLWSDNTSAWQQWAGIKTSLTIPATATIPPDFSDQETFWYSRWLGWDESITEVARLFAQRKHSAVRVKVGRRGWLTTNGDIVLVTLKDYANPKCQLVLTWDQLLMIKDVCYVRAQVMSGLRVFYPSESGLHQAVENHMAWQEQCLSTYGNQGYGILKGTEALCKSYLSVISSDKFRMQGSFLRIVQKIRDKEILLSQGVPHVPLVDKYVQMLKRCTNVQHVVELFGLQKVSGHPLIDLADSARAVREIATKPDTTAFAHAREIKWAACALFLEHYVPQSGWPDLKFTRTDTALYRLYVRRVRAFTRHSYPLSDWDGTTFGKIFSFDYSPNYLDLMDDKSISYYRSDIAAPWSKGVTPKSDRRLLMELINRKDVDLRRIVHTVVKRQVPQDWKIVTLYPKEKELKEKARMFSMLVFEMRLYFNLTEANLKRSIFPFLPELTMMDSREEVMNRFLTLTAPSKEDKMITFFYELDLSTWNSNWRALTVHGVGEIIDDMFGLPGSYTYGHTFYKESVMVVRVRGEKPNGIELPAPPTSDLLWYNHIGGTEGIRQAKWSFVTVAVISRALRDLNVSWTLTGQADNQVLCIRFPSNGVDSEDHQLLHMRDTVVTQVSDWFLRVNQVLKPEECLESTTCVTYSKDIFVSGVYYPTTLKFHARLFPQSAQDFPSLRSNIGGVYSAAVAGSERTHHPFRSLYLAHLQASIHLLRTTNGEGIFGDKLRWGLSGASTRMSPDGVKFILSLPSSLGGYPVLPWTSFVYKSGSDPLSKDLASLVWMRASSSGRLFDRVLAQLQDIKEFRKNPSLRALLQDPFSIPLNVPVSPIAGITQETLANLRPHVRTSDIREVMEASTSNYTDALVKVLCDVRPFNPLVLRDILDCSVEGIADTLRRAFIATRTLQNIARKTGENLVPKMFHSEVMIFSYLKARFERLPGNPWTPSSVYDMAVALRARWGIDGDQAPVGVTTHSPFDLQPLYGEEQLAHEGLHAVLLTPAHAALTSRGRFLPYLGGKTREKRSEHGYRIIDTDTTSRAFRKLQLISSQTGGDPAFRALIDLIGLSRSNTVLSTISPRLTSIYGGKLAHRYAARVGHSGAYYVGSPNLPSHCVITSDKSGDLSGGVYDYPFMFNEHFLSMVWILRETGLANPRSPRCLRWPTASLRMLPLPDITMTLVTGNHIPLKRFPGNKLAFLPNIRIEMLPEATNWRALNLAEKIDSLAIEDPTQQVMAVEAWARRILRTRSLGRLAADRGADTFATEVMDIAELRSIGVSRIVTAFSNVTADEFVTTASWTYWTRNDRWRSAPFGHKISFLLASTISPVVTHIIMRDDEFVRKHKLFDQPTYIESNSLPQARLCALILKGALERIEMTPVEYSKRKILLTDDGSASRPSELILSVLMRQVRYHWAMGELTNKECEKLVIRQVRPAVRSSAGEEERLQRLIAICCTLRDWATRTSKIPFSLALRDIIMGRACQSINLASQECLRLARRLEVIGAGVLSLNVPRPRQQLTSLHQWSLMFQHSQLSNPSPPSVVLKHAYPLALGRRKEIEARIFRHSGVYGVLGELSRARWRWITPLVRDKRVHIVGSGMGGAAAECLDSGAIYVTGLDLQEDLPIRPHRFIDYCPPLVLESDRWDRYEQSSLSLLTTGDWFDADVHSKFIQLDSGGDAWIIDIEGGGQLDYWTLIGPLMGKVVTGCVIVRLVSTHSYLERLAMELYGGKNRWRMLAVEGTGDPITTIVVTEGVPTRREPSHESTIIAIPSQSIMDHNHSSGSYGQALTASCRNLMIFEDTDTLDVASEYMWWFYQSSRGDYEARLGYRRWTDVLWTLIGLEWVRLPSTTRVDWILTSEVAGVAVVTINTTRIEAQWSRRLELHLTKVCSQLISR